MKKITSCLLIAGVSSTFSFYKMCDVVVHKLTDTGWIKVDNKKLDPDKIYTIYAYDTNLKYGLIDQYCSQSGFYNILKNKKFKKDKWEEIYYDLRFQARYFSVDLPEDNSTDKINLKIKDKKDFLKDKNNNRDKYSVLPLQRSITFALRSTEKYKRHPILIKFRLDGVTLIKFKLSPNYQPLRGTEKEIDFERAFKNYARSQQELRRENFLQDDNLNHHVTELAKKNNTNKLRQNAAFNIKKMDQFTYTDDQITLLEKSKILAIWALPNQYYNNEEYVKDWNNRHPHDLKKTEYKQINRIIIGYAVDERTNETFNFVTDLGQDISVLFDYSN